jgi:Protein of unknown function (DUF3035)
MRKITILTGAAALITLSGCTSGGGLFNRDRPDEFAVSRQAPLVVPPDFALTPPAPGAARPNQETAAEQTLRALFGGPAPRSGAETQVIGAAGGVRSDPAARSTVGDPDTQTVDKGQIVRDILAAPAGNGQAAQTQAGG